MDQLAKEGKLLIADTVCIHVRVSLRAQNSSTLDFGSGRLSVST